MDDGIIRVRYLIEAEEFFFSCPKLWSLPSLVSERKRHPVAQYHLHSHTHTEQAACVLVLHLEIEVIESSVNYLICARLSVFSFPCNI
jgi:hypothetical protein